MHITVQCSVCTEIEQFRIYLSAIPKVRSATVIELTWCNYFSTPSNKNNEEKTSVPTADRCSWFLPSVRCLGWWGCSVRGWVRTASQLPARWGHSGWDCPPAPHLQTEGNREQCWSPRFIWQIKEKQHCAGKDFQKEGNTENTERVLLLLDVFLERRWKLRHNKNQLRSKTKQTEDLKPSLK